MIITYDKNKPSKGREKSKTKNTQKHAKRSETL